MLLGIGMGGGNDGSGGGGMEVPWSPAYVSAGGSAFTGSAFTGGVD